MNNIRLVICGPDKVGKTTICAALSKKLNVPMYKCSKDRTKSHFINTNENAKLNILKWAIPEQLDLIEQCNVSVIYDRFFPSEWVYAHAINRETSDELVFEYDKWWNNIGGKIIFLYKDLVIQDDEHIEGSLFEIIKNRYVEYSKLTSCKHMFLNTTNEDLEQQLEAIVQFINKE